MVTRRSLWWPGAGLGARSVALSALSVTLLALSAWSVDSVCGICFCVPRSPTQAGRVGHPGPNSRLCRIRGFVFVLRHDVAWLGCAFRLARLSTQATKLQWRDQRDQTPGLIDPMERRSLVNSGILFPLKAASKAFRARGTRNARGLGKFVSDSPSSRGVPLRQL